LLGPVCRRRPHAAAPNRRHKDDAKSSRPAARPGRGGSNTSTIGKYQQKHSANEQSAADQWRHRDAFAVLGLYLQGSSVHDRISVGPENAAKGEHDDACDKQQNANNPTTGHKSPPHAFAAIGGPMSHAMPRCSLNPSS
jgi:hypothetical protein